MNARHFVAGMMVAIATSANAFPRDPYANCPSIMSKEKFESQGGNLVITKQPDLGSIPRAFLKACQGYAGFSMVVRTDGSIAFGPDPKFFPDNKKPDGLDGLLHCTFPLMHRVEKMRYMPPQAQGKLSCVEFRRFWHSSKPRELAAQP